MTILQSMENIKKYYSIGETEVLALSIDTLHVYEGEMLAIMGTSGSGKSTLLNLLGAIDSPDEGWVSISGKIESNYFKEPFASQYRSENVSFVFQDYNLLSDLNVEDNLSVPLILKKKSKEEINTRVSQIASLVGLDHRLKHKPSELSGGQRQRVAIARALIDEPKILLADEPTGNLDYKMSKDIMTLFKEVQKKFNQTIVIVTHDAEIASYADRIIFLHDGKIKKEINTVSSIKEIVDTFVSIETSLGGHNDI